MSTRGQRAVRDALRNRHEQLESAFFAQATVTAVTSSTVTVRFPGATATQTWPRLNPALGVDVDDVVLMGGQPGSWACLGVLGAVRDVAARGLTTTRAARLGSTLDVAGSAGVAGDLDVSGYVAKAGGYTLTRVTNFPALIASGNDVALLGANGALAVTNPANSASRNINAANVSERRLKEHVADVDDGLAVIEKLRPARWRWADAEERGDESVHVGIYVDELAEAQPDAVRETVSGELGYEMAAPIADLVSAVQTLAAENRVLRARVEALESAPAVQPIGSTVSRDQPEYDENTGMPPSSSEV